MTQEKMTYQEAFLQSADHIALAKNYAEQAKSAMEDGEANEALVASNLANAWGQIANFERWIGEQIFNQEDSGE